ncbi:type II toxin-antitoxin system HicA family toxin [Dyadobacter sp. Leaf189]|uniref:type II toxin-antitoxin system HicA family toxin n=1 Tax=Dyadobacter sp. Leaf189 TaxID=1736295 RepID=UPI0006F49F51|nr:type II toxin-antitoxin system HicA family toxin [Dyadobacter sp. Leaf189]KQS26868.1 hexulose-6-phosphate synthase [Dyadobacter sp. Leaf189]
MSKIEKLLARFFNKPKDLTWKELVLVLEFYGYRELPTGATGGSRRKFADAAKHIISLHKPHPGQIVKFYVIEQVIEILEENGKVKND